jgi:hypothetical protein
MFAFMAFAVAPISVVMPVLQLHLALRFWLARILNPQHEIFGNKMLMGTACSLLGGLALSLDTEFFLALVALPAAVVDVLRWTWP